MMSTEEISAEELLAEKELCTILASIFWNTPSKDVFELIEAYRPSPTSYSDKDVAMERLKESINDLDNDGLTNLKIDYAHTFISAEKNAPFPYESVYRGEGRLMMQEPCSEAIRLYDDVDFQWAECHGEPPDHISIELRFVSHLLAQAIAHAEMGNYATASTTLEYKNEYTKSHIRSWVPLFCSEAEDRAETDFYKLAAQATRAYANG